jgi:hypothetical protein
MCVCSLLCRDYDCVTPASSASHLVVLTISLSGLAGIFKSALTRMAQHILRGSGHFSHSLVFGIWFLVADMEFCSEV